MIAARRHAPAIGLLCAMAALLIASKADESPTSDEPFHLVRGLSYWWTGSAALSYAHPPLANALAALPVALTSPPVDFQALPEWRNLSVEGIATAYLAEHYTRSVAELGLARAVIALMTVLLGVYLYRLALAAWGLPTALVTLFLFAFHPVLLAHGSLDTTDVPVALWVTVALGEFTRYLARPGTGRLWTSALAVAAAMCTKYNGIFALLLAAGLGAWAAWRGSGRFSGLSRRHALAHLGGDGIFAAALCLFAINAVYRFEDTGLTVDHVLSRAEPDNETTKSFQDKLLEDHTLIDSLPAWLPLPVPYTYLFGFVSVRQHDAAGHPSVFFGAYSRTGWVAYFPVMLFAKSPFAVMLGAGMGLVLAWKARRRGWPLGWTSKVLIAACTAYMALAMSAQINIGVRHLLPIIPALILLAARGLTHVFELAGDTRWKNPAAGLLAAGYIAGAAMGFPDYISDFGIQVGGRPGGHLISVIGEDWGQDMNRFLRFIKERQALPLLYKPYNFAGALALRHENIRYTSIRCNTRNPGAGWLAIHISTLERSREQCIAWVRARTPDHVINRHIYLYDLRPGD